MFYYHIPVQLSGILTWIVCDIGWSQNNSAYNIHNLVPLETGTTFKELAEKTGVPVKKLTRLLRHGMTDHLFREPTPGHVKHTIATKALVLMPRLATWSEMSMYEVGPSKMHVS